MNSIQNLEKNPAGKNKVSKEWEKRAILMKVSSNTDQHFKREIKALSGLCGYEVNGA